MSLDRVAAVVIGDIALVLTVSWLLGALARRCGQPAVVGQILTGLLLGSSVLGRLPGHLTSFLFPHQAIPYLSVLSQVAIVVFMFLVGYEIDIQGIRSHGRLVPLIAVCALLVPMGLGSGSAALLGSVFTAAGQHSVAGHSFILFVGVATSVTALPVLAAIVRERGIADSSAGVVAMAAAGAMDVMAWIALGAALAGSPHSPKRSWLLTLVGVILLTAFMLLVLRRLLRWWFGRPAAVLAQQLPVAIVLAMGSACITSLLGLHVFFGGFLAGLTMARSSRAPDADVVRGMQGAGNLMLPLFFVVTGLSLNIGSIGPGGLALLGLVFAIGCIGKLVPAYAASRLGGLPPRQAATVAALLNTRGLTELIALNAGLQSGIIGRGTFTIFVLMALITTALTSPLLALIGPAGQVIPTEEAPVVADRAARAEGGPA
jgi:Kef-type K+ transport system membrane component KefB